MRKELILLLTHIFFLIRYTNSVNFPVTLNGYNSTFNKSSYDCFITEVKMDNSVPTNNITQTNPNDFTKIIISIVLPVITTSILSLVIFLFYRKKKVNQ